MLHVGSAGFSILLKTMCTTDINKEHPSYQHGIRAGQKIVAINGIAVHSFTGYLNQAKDAPSFIVTIVDDISDEKVSSVNGKNSRPGNFICRTKDANEMPSFSRHFKITTIPVVRDENGMCVNSKTCINHRS